MGRHDGGMEYELVNLTGGLDWIDDAECRNMDLHDFFPAPGRLASEAAQAACARCPVKRNCLEYITRLDIRHGYAASLYLAHRR